MSTLGLSEPKSSPLGPDDDLGVVVRRYFFDVDDRGRRVRDEVGFDLEDENRAMREANLLTYALFEAARLEPRSGTILVRVRDERGSCLYEASMSLADE